MRLKISPLTMERCRPPRPPVLAIYRASGRPPTIKHRLAPSLARVRSGGRGRAAIFSPSRARTPSLSACHKESESHRWSAGWWRGRCDRTPPCRLLTARSAKNPQNTHDLSPRRRLRPRRPKSPGAASFSVVRRSCRRQSGRNHTLRLRARVHRRRPAEIHAACLRGTGCRAREKPGMLL